MPECQHCAGLRDEIAYLKSELGQAVEAREISAARAAFGLSKNMAHLLLALHKAGDRPVSRLRCLEAMPFRASSDRDMSTVSTVICKLRQRVPRGAIETLPALGYRLSPAGRQAVGEVIA
jgi:DNA-binding response OmpR family regulator